MYRECSKCDKVLQEGEELKQDHKDYIIYGQLTALKNPKHTDLCVIAVMCKC